MLVNDSVPTKLPKLNSKFSVEWLVKGDTVKDKISDKLSINTSNEFKRELSPVSPLDHSPIDTSRCEKRDLDSPKFTGNYPESPLQIKSDLMHASLPHLSSHVTVANAAAAAAAAETKSSPTNYFDQKSMQIGHHIGQMATHQNHILPPQYTMTMPNGLPVPLAAVQHHQQLLNSQLQMAAALNYQYNASMQPQATHFNQIFSNNFHRTSYQIHRFPYGYTSGKWLFCDLIISYNCKFYNFFLPFSLLVSVHSFFFRSLFLFNFFRI